MTEPLTKEQDFIDYIRKKVNIERIEKGLPALSESEIIEAFKIIEALATSFEAKS